jgi:hypothetical protein
MVLALYLTLCYYPRMTVTTLTHSCNASLFPNAEYNRNCPRDYVYFKQRDGRWDAVRIVTKDQALKQIDRDWFRLFTRRGDFGVLWAWLVNTP